MPRFLHVKPKAKPENIEAFRRGKESTEAIVGFAIPIAFILVFPLEYYSNISMSLNQTRSIPNSTDVWWEMSESRDGFKVSPSCKSHTELEGEGTHDCLVFLGFSSSENYLSMIFFNDKISPANISFLTRYG